MSKKQMTLGELVRWMDDNGVSYEVDDAGRLTVKGDLKKRFMDWVRTRKYTNLPDELVHVDGTLWLERTSIVSLGNLISVGGDFDLCGTPITSLGNLTSVGGWLDLEGAPITSLGNLISVGGSLLLDSTPLTSLGNLASVGEGLYLAEVPITSLDNLTFVGWSLMLQGASIPSLDDLPQVGEDLFLDQSQIQLLTREALQKVTGKIQYQNQATEKWIALSPAELEAIVAENERRERLNNTRENQVDWDLYDR